MPISSDTLLVERGRFYATIVCDLDDPIDPTPYSELELLLGRHTLRAPTPALRELIAHHASSARARVDGLSRAKRPDPDALAQARSLLDALQSLL